MNLETVFLNKMREADFAYQAMAAESYEEEEEAELEAFESASLEEELIEEEE